MEEDLRKAREEATAAAEAGQALLKSLAEVRGEKETALQQVGINYYDSLCDQSFLNESAYSADESNVKVHPSTTFVKRKIFLYINHLLTAQCYP